MATPKQRKEKYFRQILNRVINFAHSRGKVPSFDGFVFNQNKGNLSGFDFQDSDLAGSVIKTRCIDTNFSKANLYGSCPELSCRAWRQANTGKKNLIAFLCLISITKETKQTRELLRDVRKVLKKHDPQMMVARGYEFDRLEEMEKDVGSA